MKKEIILYLTFLYAVALPISTKLANIVLLLIGLFVTIDIIVKREKFNFTWKYIFSTTSFIIVLLTIGLLFTDDVGYALKYYERFCSYIIIPVLFSFLSLKKLLYLKKYSFIGLVVGSILSCLILLSNDFYKYFKFKQAFVIESDLFSYNYTYHEFASILGIHPTFLGIYFVFAIVIANEYRLWFGKFVSYLISTILIIGLVFVNSRVPFFLFGIYFLVYLIRSLKSNYKEGVKSVVYRIVPVVSICVVCLYVFKDTYIYKRMTRQLIWELTENKGTTYDGVYTNDSRVSRWEALFQKSLEKPVFGFGAASEDRVVLESYKENNLTYALENKYGPHNQYLSFLLEYGLLGLAMFLMYLFANLGSAFINRNLVAFLFFVFFTISCFFDSLLYLNSGVIFFAFYGNLFTIINYKEIVLQNNLSN